MHCDERKLRQKWHLDLLNALQELFSPCGKPALLSQEEDFHTVCVQRTTLLAGQPRLLLPMHQAIYNSESLDFAFPNARQRHGRTVDFKATSSVPLPHAYYESVKSAWTVRQS